jgi:hypothetical protein
VERFAAEPAALAINHPAYQQALPSSDKTKQGLILDLRPD